jgi:Cu2+-exporting ATPase
MLEIDGAPRALCCIGCEAAAALIADAGLENYYRLRSAVAATPSAAATDLSHWDRPELLAGRIRQRGEQAEITVLVEGMRCAACAWLIGRALGRIDGVESLRVNATTARLTLCWRPGRVALSRVLASLVRLGYRPHLATRASDQLALAERRTLLKRLIVAGLGMMQAMMFAEALYFGAEGGMDLATRDAFRWLGLLLATPVVFYSGWPFLRGALNELALRRPAMDTLVASTVLIAYGASLLETVRGGAEVYFDSAVMFVFLLLATRFVERDARLRANAAVDLLARAQPASAHRVEGESVIEVPAAALVAGDRVRVRPGEAVPADGKLSSAAGAFDEALLSGESRPVAKSRGAEVLAGSVCVEAPVDLDVTRVGTDTVVAQMLRVVERAQSERPRAALLADRIASGFVIALFVLTAAVAATWYVIDADRSLPIALAVLAVSCPCALSLALPAALAAAHARLAAQGVLVLRPDALESLARVDTVVFDKTGTLSEGVPQLIATAAAPGVDASTARALAAALERDVLHPLAHAFAPCADAAVRASEVRVTAGAGVEGTIDGRRYRLGRAAFALADADTADLGELVLAEVGASQALARFTISDRLRADARATCAQLARAGINAQLESGDGERAVAECATALGITRWHARQSPAEKLAAVRTLQADGRVVAMVGDGINDAAVLAGADVSLAPTEAAALAHAASDVVIPAQRLGAVAETLAVARQTRRIVRQNLAWALGYNLLALPLAALGLVPAWAAAIGMSVSSLVVTLNALRLARRARSDPGLAA